jgi:gluconolactonase
VRAASPYVGSFGSASNSVCTYIFAPNGDRIGQILLPEKCANICFGGAKRNRLFMAASQSIYAVYVETQGVQIP